MKNLIVALILSLSCIAWGQSVCIDAGHGGSDPGALGHGLRESDINLDVAQRLADLMRASGWTVYMTRTSDSTVSLSARTSYANSHNASRFVSIHCNAFNQSAHGTETYSYTSGSSTSHSMRDRVNPQVVYALSTYNRGCKTAGFYVLRYTNMPAILCELAFIDNQSDAAKLGNSYYRQRAAEAIRTGVLNTGRESAPEAASEPRILWSPDSREFVAGNPESQIFHLISPVEGVARELASRSRSEWRSGIQRKQEGIRAVAENGAIWIEDGSERRRLTEDRGAFQPVLSPDRSMAAYCALDGSLFVCTIDGSTHLSLGFGSNPCWSPDSRRIFFEVSEDDGHEVVASDICFVEISNPGRRVNLTAGFPQIAQMPSVSPDGSCLVFDSQGTLCTARIAGQGIEDVRRVLESE